MPDEKRRGICRDCGRSIQLTKDGNVRQHGGPKSTAWPYRRWPCEGAGAAPEDDKGSADAQ